MTRKDVQVNFRMPETLKAELELASKANNRSLTAEIVSRLEDSLRQPPMGSLFGVGKSHKEPVDLNILIDSNGMPMSLQEAVMHLNYLTSTVGIDAAHINMSLISPEDNRSSEQRIDDFMRTLDRYRAMRSLPPYEDDK